MARLYIYKMVVDNGGAPCVTSSPRLLSLALCKPAIRRSAEARDVVFGFAGNQMAKEYPKNPLIYVAEITLAICGERYYSNAEFSARHDCIYSYDGRTFRRRRRAIGYHDDQQLDKDLGKAPTYKSARVLLSEKFRYFANRGPRADKQEYPMLAKLLKCLMNGHRVNHTPALRDELLRFKRSAWQTHGLGRTSEPPKNSRHCGGEDKECFVESCL